MMGAEAAWIALSGQHDEIDGGGTVLAIAGHSSASVPIKWFVHGDPFPVISPSPTFDEEIALADGDHRSQHHPQARPRASGRCGRLRTWTPSVVSRRQTPDEGAHI
ncbi:DUF6807 family protein [Nonomuraea composti]|uniref:DUF6807 family protein n=1 Tax=Nonomuraea composti TaxID=2720023 RepID=UPI001F0CE329|nr:DUF6807 family protein [Nonomuraea sp. FMUSA5-5]